MPETSTTATNTSSGSSKSEENANQAVLSFLSENIDREEILDICKENHSFSGYLRGYLAERRLKSYLESVPGIEGVEKIDDHERRHRADFRFLYRGRPVYVEAKSFSMNGIKDDWMEGGRSAVITLKRTGSTKNTSQVNSVHVPRGEFDILAVSHVALTGICEFSFIHNKYLPEAEDKPGFIRSSFRMNPDYTPCLHRDISRVLKDLG